MKTVNFAAACRVRLTASGVAVGGHSALARTLAFADALLRGVGQVLLQNNSYAGLLFVVGVFCNSALFGCGVLFGTAVSTATALALGAGRRRVRAGLFGFNGALVAIALLYFLRPDALTWGYVAVAAAVTTVVMAALSRGLAAWKLPAFTAPFVVTTLVFVLASARFGRLQVTDVLPTAGLPRAATVEGIVTGATLWQGLFHGLSQVFFQHNLVTGVVFALGLLVSSRAACVLALAASLLGLLVAWGLGAGEPAMRAGAFGFNCVLTAIALGGAGLGRNAAALLFGLLGVVVTAVVFAAWSAALEPIGMPALTAPFVLVSWLCLLARPWFTRLRAGLATG